ncbi:MAG: ABC transporter permease [Nocardioides sp.]|uniref:ABC transporter permease n=1 Tax=Nocardioides sp. TaxID=35761 RepID=UPI0039E348D7
MILIRLAYGVLALWAVSVLVFLATQALPGDAAVTALGRNATPAGLASFRARFDLDAPLITQYWDWLRHVLSGNLGVSFSMSSSVSAVISSRVVDSLVLMAVSAVISIPLAVWIGVYTASRRDRLGDHLMSFVVLVINALPEFVMAVAVVVLLATNVFQILPAVSALDPNDSILGQWRLLVLPVLTLVLMVVPYVARTVRACMIEELASEHVRMARLKGLTERRIILRHALPNIAGPTFQVVAQSLAYLAGSIVVIETVFQYPGVGQALDQAVSARDIPVIQALACLLAAFYILVNILADIGTVAMTPTLRKRAR